MKMISLKTLSTFSISKDEVQVARSIDGFPLMKHVLGYFPNIAHV
jgi:hypothetical protein